jgi:RHS repeat-associated protein
MVRTRRDPWCNSATCNSTITRFIWDGDQVLAEIRGEGGQYFQESGGETGPQYGRVVYTHGGGLDQPLDIMRSDGIGGAAHAMLPIPTWRGSFVAGTNAAGEMLCAPGVHCEITFEGAHSSSFLLAGAPVEGIHWYGSLAMGNEDASGTIYMRNRYYNPQTGTFTQQDPIGLAGGLNTYGFANGDPVTYSDPYGLCREKDRICERFVSQLRELARSTDNPNFGVAADVLDETRNRVVFVKPDDRRLGGAMASTATGCGFLGLGRCVYLRNDLGPGDQVAAVAHEAHYHVRHGVALPDGVQVDDRYQFDLSIQKSLPAHYQPTTVLNRDRLRALGVLQ